MSSSSQMKQALRQLERAGFVATKTNGGHRRFTHPQMNGVVFAPSTPSDHRSIKNVRSKLRRKFKNTAG